MKIFVGLLASLVVNFAGLRTLDLWVQEAQPVPAGEVSVTQLPDEGGLLYARIASRAGQPASDL